MKDAESRVAAGHLPRLAPEFYRGFAFVHWIYTTEDRTTGWLNPSIHTGFHELLLHACARYALTCPVYCLMPDHMHMVWLGMRPDSDQLLATKFLREHSGRLIRPARWQRPAYDHVLREKERERGAFQGVCHYIRENPVRKGLCEAASDYPFANCVVPGYPELDLRDTDFWLRFWRVYEYIRRKRPA